MVVQLVLWSLADSTVPAATLRAELADEPLPRPDGVLLAALVSDEASDRFGAIVVGDPEAVGSAVPDRLRELIGSEPVVVEEFDLEATASIVPELSGLGLAFES